MKIFGGFKAYPDGYASEAKEELRKELHAFIDELCDRDDFWITKEKDTIGTNPLKATNTVGWKIAILHMEEEKETSD